MKTHTRHQPTTLGRVVRRAVVTAAASVAIIGAAFATVSVLVDQFQIEMSYGPSYDTNVDAVEAMADARALTEQHDCWTDLVSAPAGTAGQQPGHVIVTTVADPANATYSAELVEPALDEVHGVGDSGLVVHAFCR